MTDVQQSSMAQNTGLGVDAATATQAVDYIKKEVTQNRNLIPGFDSLSLPEQRTAIKPIAEAALAKFLNAKAIPMPLKSQERLVQHIQNKMFGLGELQPLLDDDNVENIDINGYDKVFVQYADGTKRRHPRPIAKSNEDLVLLISSAIRTSGLAEKPWGGSRPILSVRLPDGARMTAVAWVSETPSISIRRHRLDDVTLEDLLGYGMFDADMKHFLESIMNARANVIIAGDVGCGKTTLLKAMFACLDPMERIITIEQVLELGLHLIPHRHADAVAMEERLGNAEGAGHVSMADLVVATRKMNSSRVIVGEVVDGAVVSLLNTMASGNGGTCATLHAKSSADVFNKILTLAAQSVERLTAEAAVMLLTQSVDLVIFLDRDPTTPNRARVISSIREVTGSREGLTPASSELYAPDPVTKRATLRGLPSQRLYERMLQAGYEPPSKYVSDARQGIF
ncbi:CpaF family protein [Ferrimicrobium acidiphilum]|uniref:CpaF family protein n=1 Tax=Ferrimicrobium acidiphilum TaxID=121039 RepID=UPI0023EFBF02|nr:ATPase, T2SS/T4P/T4SS family [Ferrimicrobium acidiphilum]